MTKSSFFGCCFGASLLLFLSSCGTEKPSNNSGNIALADTTATTVQPNPKPDTMPKLDTIVQDTQPIKKPKPQLAPPRIEWDKATHNYGEINAGDIIEHTFKFKNVGERPLEINDAKGSCGCTQPSFNFLPIRPNESSEIKVRFDSKGKVGKQKATITVISNAEGSPHSLILEGIVK